MGPIDGGNGLVQFLLGVHHHPDHRGYACLPSGSQGHACPRHPHPFHPHGPPSSCHPPECRPSHNIQGYHGCLFWGMTQWKKRKETKQKEGAFKVMGLLVAYFPDDLPHGGPVDTLFWVTNHFGFCYLWYNCGHYYHRRMVPCLTYIFIIITISFPNISINTTAIFLDCWTCNNQSIRLASYILHSWWNWIHLVDFLGCNSH